MNSITERIIAEIRNFQKSLAKTGGEEAVYKILCLQYVIKPPNGDISKIPEHKIIEEFKTIRRKSVPNFHYILKCLI